MQASLSKKSFVSVYREDTTLAFTCRIFCCMNWKDSLSFENEARLPATRSLHIARTTDIHQASHTHTSNRSHSRVTESCSMHHCHPFDSGFADSSNFLQALEVQLMQIEETGHET